MKGTAPGHVSDVISFAILSSRRRRAPDPVAQRAFGMLEPGGITLFGPDLAPIRRGPGGPHADSLGVIEQPDEVTPNERQDGR